MRAVLDYIAGIFDVRGRATERVEAQRHARAMQMKELDAKVEAQRAESEARLISIRAAEEMAKKDAHEQTLELMEAVLSRVQAISTANQEALGEVARSTQKQGEALTAWMSLFQSHQGPGDTQTLRPEDEWALEQQRELKKLEELGYVQGGAEEDVVTARVAGMFSAADRG